MKNSARELRQAFIRYFEQQGHQAVPSSALIPQADPTLLFTNAGMNQFKRVFLGEESRAYKRAVTVQKCLRAGGKHNDLENVGYTRRHHTFFEMLGNFSIGDYFKDDAIRFGFELSTEVLGFDPEQIWITVFEGMDGVPADDEALEKCFTTKARKAQRAVARAATAKAAPAKAAAILDSMVMKQAAMLAFDRLFLVLGASLLIILPLLLLMPRGRFARGGVIPDH